MAAALECWSSRASTDEAMVEEVLMRTLDRSDCPPGDSSSENPDAGSVVRESSALQRRLQRLGRNVSEAIASLKNSLNLDSGRDPASPPNGRVESCRKQVWGRVVRNLTQLHPGGQLPEKLISNIRKHFDSLPLSYAEAGFEMKDVFLHIKLIEQASSDDHPAIMIQDVSDDEVQDSVFKLTFACNSSVSWPAMSSSLDNASISYKNIQIFDKKGLTLGVVLLLLQPRQEKMLRTQVEHALKLALKKPKPIKLSFGLCGCQDENTRGRELGETEEGCSEQDYRNGIENSSSKIQLSMPLPTSSYVVSVDEWQTVQSGGDEIGKWLLNSDSLEFTDQIGSNMFKGLYKGMRVGIEKLKGCDKGNSYQFKIKRDLLELMTCGHRNILQFHGVCIDDNHGLCVVTKFMEGGSVHDVMRKNKQLQTKEIIRIAADVAAGIKFLIDHGVVYRDLNTHKILLDKHGNACLGDMGVLSACEGAVEAMDYETDGYRWLAPEIIAGDPECVTETWMSNAYSFGMVIWEMVTGEAAYSAYSPVQAAVGVAACGLRPDIPKDCPQVLKSLMTKCWNNSPSKRPQFSEILMTLTRPVNSFNSGDK